MMGYKDQFTKWMPLHRVDDEYARLVVRNDAVNAVDDIIFNMMDSYLDQRGSD